MKYFYPIYRKVVKTYCHRSGLVVKEVEDDSGITDLIQLWNIVSDNTAGVLIQHPNFFGNLKEVDKIGKIIHAACDFILFLLTPFH